jgi:hypothetical protein
MDIGDVVRGGFYRCEATGWEGRCTGVARRDPTPLQSYWCEPLEVDVTAVGPHPGDSGRWVVMLPTGNFEDVALSGIGFTVPPRVELLATGPKGAPEKRFFLAEALVDVGVGVSDG